MGIPVSVYIVEDVADNLMLEACIEPSVSSRIITH